MASTKTENYQIVEVVSEDERVIYHPETNAENVLVSANGIESDNLKGALEELASKPDGGTSEGAVSSVNGKTGEVVLSKEDVGLGQVNNTPDEEKPISKAVQAALDKKANAEDLDAKADIAALADKADKSDLEDKVTQDALDAAVSPKADKSYVEGELAKKANTEDLGELASKDALTAQDVGLGNLTNDAQVKRSEMGEANGVATLDGTGRVPAAQLPGFVDDVECHDNRVSFPEEGEDGKIYIDKETNKQYRWDGVSDYVEIASSLALGESASTAYAGNKGKANADAIEDLRQQVATLEGKDGTQDSAIEKAQGDATAAKEAATANATKLGELEEQIQAGVGGASEPVIIDMYMVQEDPGMMISGEDLNRAIEAMDAGKCVIVRMAMEDFDGQEGASAKYLMAAATGISIGLESGESMKGLYIQMGPSFITFMSEDGQNVAVEVEEFASKGDISSEVSNRLWEYLRKDELESQLGEYAKQSELSDYVRHDEAEGLLKKDTYMHEFNVSDEDKIPDSGDGKRGYYVHVQDEQSGYAAQKFRQALKENQHIIVRIKCSGTQLDGQSEPKTYVLPMVAVTNKEGDYDRFECLFAALIPQDDAGIQYASLKFLSSHVVESFLLTDIAYVASVNGKSGTVTLNKEDIGLPEVVTSVNGRSDAVTLTKGDVGLDQVDNTSDDDKPISKDVQTALDDVQAALDDRPTYEALGMKEFSSASWDDIGKISRAGEAKKVWNVGDKKEITLTTGEKITMVILGFDHDDLSDGSGKAGITLGMEECIGNGTDEMNGMYPMYDSSAVGNATSPEDSRHQWSASEMRNTTMEEFYARLPQEVQSVIRPVDKVGNLSQTVSDKLFLLSGIEVFGDTSYAVYRSDVDPMEWSNNYLMSQMCEGKQYEYFKNSPPITPKQSDITGTFQQHNNTGCYYWGNDPFKEQGTLAYDKNGVEVKGLFAGSLYNYNAAKFVVGDTSKIGAWWLRSPCYLPYDSDTSKQHRCCMATEKGGFGSFNGCKEFGYVSFAFCI